MRVNPCIHHSCNAKAMTGEKWCYDHHPDKGNSRLREVLQS